MSADPDKSRRQLAALAWRRFRSAVENEKQPERLAFEETIITLLEQQDEAWAAHTGVRH